MDSLIHTALHCIYSYTVVSNHTEQNGKTHAKSRKNTKDEARTKKVYSKSDSVVNGNEH